jgi:hypothetical protein
MRVEYDAQREWRPGGGVGGDNRARSRSDVKIAPIGRHAESRSAVSAVRRLRPSAAHRCADGVLGAQERILRVNDLGPKQLKNIADSIRVYSLQVGSPAPATSTAVGATTAPNPAGGPRVGWLAWRTWSPPREPAVSIATVNDKLETAPRLSSAAIIVLYPRRPATSRRLDQVRRIGE